MSASICHLLVALCLLLQSGDVEGVQVLQPRDIPLFVAHLTHQDSAVSGMSQRFAFNAELAADEDVPPTTMWISRKLPCERDRNDDNATSCYGVFTPDALPKEETEKLRKNMQTAVSAFGYDSKKKSFQVHKGKRMLDLGMGQGPLCMLAMEHGVSHYTGLDPALCINKHACTRDLNIKRTPIDEECERVGKAGECGMQCSEYLSCMALLQGKYKVFPFTAVQMMQAYHGKVKLLPGTFETLEGTGALQKGAYDVVMLRSVTEHLPDDFNVVRQVFEVLEKGQHLCVLHHNYYGWDGHHSVPNTVRDFHEANGEEFQELAQWRHLNEGTTAYNVQSLNRVRLGDLMAMLDIYFACSWKSTTTPDVAKELTPEIFAPLEARGFTKTELIVTHLYLSCARRGNETVIAGENWLANRLWHHPPTDGTYTAQPLPPTMVEQVLKTPNKGAELHHKHKNSELEKCW